MLLLKKIGVFKNFIEYQINQSENNGFSVIMEANDLIDDYIDDVIFCNIKDFINSDVQKLNGIIELYIGYEKYDIDLSDNSYYMLCLKNFLHETMIDFSMLEDQFSIFISCNNNYISYNENAKYLQLSSSECFYGDTDPIERFYFKLKNVTIDLFNEILSSDMFNIETHIMLCLESFFEYNGNEEFVLLIQDSLNVLKEKNFKMLAIFITSDNYDFDMNVLNFKLKVFLHDILIPKIYSNSFSCSTIKWYIFK